LASFAPPGEQLLRGQSPPPRNLRDNHAGLQRFLYGFRLLVIRPSATAFPAAGDHFYALDSLALRVKRMIKSGHKPYLLQEIRLAAVAPVLKVSSEQR
jgi:hypothetical protein